MSRDDRDGDRCDDTSRRGFLKVAGALGATAGLGGIASADVGGQQEFAETIELMALKDGWLGQKPNSIKGTVNPTLELEAGKNYRVKWLNGDGASHNFVITGRGDNFLVFSPFMHAQAEYQTVEFTATEKMEEYHCEIHPYSMRGDLKMSETTQQTTTEQQ